MAVTNNALLDDSYVLAVAIDFGTTFSGYSFSFITSQDDIHMNKEWGNETGLPSYKTPTSVLVDKSGKMLAFGYEAETRYNELIADQDEECCELYRHFKMTLHSQRNLTRKSKVQSVSGKWEDAMKIFTHALRYLKDHVINAIAKTVANAPDTHSIRWVLTVPAIWREQSKKFMREAAFQAGLIDDLSSRRMIICLEPEAAAIYCRRLDIDKFSAGNDQAVKLMHKTNTKYMIVDAGGGTIDVTVHEVQKDGKVKELRAASGGAWGGTKVDENFVNVLVNVFGKYFINHFQNKRPSDWLDLCINFERRKRSVKAKGKGSGINIPIGLNFATECQEITGKHVKDLLNSNVVQGVSFKNGNISFDIDVVRGFFEPVVSKIVEYIQGELLECPDVEFILLVGGFSESDFLHDAVKAAFCPKIQILVPLEASISIVKGATLFGHQLNLISSRVARKTYGVDCYVEFDSAKHCEDKKEYLPDQGEIMFMFWTSLCEKMILY